MKRPTVFLTHSPQARAHYYGARALAALQAVAEVRYSTSDTVWTPETLAGAARDCDVLLSDRRTEGTATLLEQLPTLRAFVRCAVDIRNVDVAAASRLGILVTQARAGFMASVSEWIVAVMIDLSRGISAAVGEYRAGRQPTPVMGRELRGATLGIIGYGQIGRYLAPLGRAFGMRVIVADPHVTVSDADVTQVALHELLAQSDYVVCLAGATGETENLMDATAFVAMRPDAFFINASRGNLVDEAALHDALERGHLGGCALDVGRAPDQMPSPELARHPRVIATPHIGGLTPAAIEHQSLETVAQVTALAEGRMPAGAVNAAQARRVHEWFEERNRA
jgi:D-3-phosphoglycerate dehydrogenase